jgi:hypothetical protein
MGGEDVLLRNGICAVPARAAALAMAEFPQIRRSNYWNRKKPRMPKQLKRIGRAQTEPGAFISRFDQSNY